jgi:hypothetical protein
MSGGFLRHASATERAIGRKRESQREKEEDYYPQRGEESIRGGSRAA